MVWSLRIRRSCGLFSQVAQSCRAVARAWADGHAGLVYMRLKKLDDSSVGKNYEQAQVLYSTTSR